MCKSKQKGDGIVRKGGRKRKRGREGRGWGRRVEWKLKSKRERKGNNSVEVGGGELGRVYLDNMQLQL